MNRRYKILRKIIVLVGLMTLLSNIVSVAPLYAQNVWPPLRVKIEPRTEDEKIIYDVTLRAEVSWELYNVTLKIPLPEGTRLVETGAQTGGETDFDGQEVTIFFLQVNQKARQAFFSVEITDPSLTEFTTQGWFSWEGQHPGDYLDNPVTFGIDQQPLNWIAPEHRVEVAMVASATDDIITYQIYPRAKDWRRRIWDLNIKVAIPAGTEFLDTETPPNFSATFNGQEISFFNIEFSPEDELAGPLIMRVSAPLDTTARVRTHAWVSWKNSGSGVGRNVQAEEQMTMGDIVIAPYSNEIAVADRVGDTPLANYDLSGITFQETGSTLSVDFYTVGDIGSVGEPLVFALFIDSDCNRETGELKQVWGADYRVMYNHRSGQATFTPWNATQKSWVWTDSVKLDNIIDNQRITVHIPRDLLDTGQPFCWAGRVVNGNINYYPSLPGDWLPADKFAGLINYSFETPFVPSSRSPTDIFQSSASPSTKGEEADIYDIIGKLAVPMVNGWGFYDVYIFSLPTGEEITQIPNARQPHFAPDGQKLVINRQPDYSEIHNSNLRNQSGFVIEYREPIENIAEFYLDGETLVPVQSTTQDTYPFYDLQAQHIVYERSSVVVGKNGPRHISTFVQCESGDVESISMDACQVLSGVPYLNFQKRQGRQNNSYPMITSDGTLIYRACDSGSTSAVCGIYVADLPDVFDDNEDISAVQIEEDATALLSDTYAQYITFTSQRDGNWEAYLINIDGTGLRNLSNSSTSNDGLPTISPDGKWVAFISDRSGEWAVWVVSLDEGTPRKLFNLPKWTPWGSSEQAWLNERISWGP